MNGYVVSDRVAYQLFGYRPDASAGEGKTWPPELYDALRGHVVDPGRVSWDEVLPYLYGPRRDPSAFGPEETERLEGLGSGRSDKPRIRCSPPSANSR